MDGQLLRDEPGRRQNGEVDVGSVSAPAVSGGFEPSAAHSHRLRNADALPPPFALLKDGVTRD
jgi:hypothetical protein